MCAYLAAAIGRGEFILGTHYMEPENTQPESQQPVPNTTSPEGASTQVDPNELKMPEEPFAAPTHKRKEQKHPLHISKILIFIGIGLLLLSILGGIAWAFMTGMFDDLLGLSTPTAVETAVPHSTSTAAPPPPERKSSPGLDFVDRRPDTSTSTDETATSSTENTSSTETGGTQTTNTNTNTSTANNTQSNTPSQETTTTPPPEPKTVDASTDTSTTETFSTTTVPDNPQ